MRSRGLKGLTSPKHEREKETAEGMRGKRVHSHSFLRLVSERERRAFSKTVLLPLSFSQLQIFPFLSPLIPIFNDVAARSSNEVGEKTGGRRGREAD